MSAGVMDLEIVQADGATWFEFTWLGRGDEWREALDLLKQWIPPAARSFDPETRRWRVRGDYEPGLCQIFGNFAAALDAVRSQLNLFGGGAS
jgi:hypothetical protein